MKLQKQFVVFSLFFVALNAFAQTGEKNITLSFTNIPLSEAIKRIEQSGRYTFFYDALKIDLGQKVSLKAANTPIEQAIGQMLEKSSVSFEITNYQIALYRKETAQASQAAVQRISGTVASDNGEPVIGATVAVRNSSNATMTDASGKFSLTVPVDAVLAISYLGYETQEINVNGRTDFRVTLKEDNRLLDEVVVVGYGTQRKALVTSAISTLKPTENTRLVVNPGDMLDGTVPGVTIAKTSGNLGSGLSFSVRGAASLNAGNNPLIVVDGIPLVSYDAGISSFGESMSSLSTINTADIESIEILKDAASAAIYGSRATNGVVLITTKSGKSGKSKLDINVNTGVSQFARNNKFKMADSKLWLEVVNEGIDNYNKQNNLNPSDVGYLLHRNNPFGNLPDVDWLGLVLQSAFTYNADVAVSGGNDKTTYYIGGSYLSQDGVIKTNHLDKMSLKTNVNHRLNNWFELGANNNIVYTHNNRIPGASLGTSTIGRTITQRPYDRPYKPNGDYYVGGTDDLI
ncbi:MAG: SusC/RagA family TonB-linked outer membrane protein, partial [Prevotellaceae bacterium]|nr:SusC/RagA family TonB-linked outer membrane protein [Prevotellaceae bacterium]